jgi:leucyl aminopeptidase
LTFDAGGISLKPSAKMDEMRYDMSGGAAVLGVFHALAKLDVPWEVHGVVPASENLMDGSATKPGDIHTAMNGKTVEVLNTDAEGRLILADALCYAEQKIKPDTIIDLATLTGAVVMGLGHELSGAYPSTTALKDALVAAGERVGELVWPMPLLEVHKSAMKGRVADLANISSPAVGAGSVTGAAFLSNFVSDSTEWCHLDIAGTAWGAAQRDWVGGAQGTGVGTRLLIEYLETRK